MDLNLEKNTSGLLGELFQHIVHDMKRMMPMWEEFIVKTNKLSVSLRSTVSSLSSFLDTLQKIADIATGARGATKDIGSGLTRLCLRHRNIESKLKTYNSGLLDAMVTPIQEKLEEWKKSLMVLDKEHSKDHKKTKQELRKMSAEVIALQTKVRKGKPEAQIQLDDALHGIKSKTLHFEEFQKSAVRSALVEERTRFCLFISCLKPVMDMEISVLTELTHIQEVVDSLCMQAGDPSCLPATSEQIILDIQEMKSDWFCQTPPDTPLSQNSSFHSINSNHSSQSSDSPPPSVKSQLMKNAMNKAPFMPTASSTSDDSGFVGGHDVLGTAASISEKWTSSLRQRSWTGLAQIRSGRELMPPKSTLSPYHTGSIRVSGRKKCPDINMVDDLPFRSPSHAHSLPPTPNPYAVPSLLTQTEGNCLSLDKFCKNSREKAISKELQRMTVDLDGLHKTGGMWTTGSLTSFDNESSFNDVIQGLSQNSSAVMNSRQSESEMQHSDPDADELAAAMQELEWTTAMLDSLSTSSMSNNPLKVCEENLEKDESQISSNGNDPSATRNLSKPPRAGILRRSSMQGARKPPPPIRRTSSITGSSQFNFYGNQATSVSAAENQLLNSAVEQNSNDGQMRVSMTTVATTTDSAAVTAMATEPSSTKMGLQSASDARDGHLPGNGRKLPKINRTVSQSIGKTVLEEERERLPGAQKEKSRLPRRSLSDTHADIIQTLNEQFSTLPAPVLLPTDKYPAPPRLPAGNGGSKLSSPNKPGGVKSPEIPLSQIPEGVTLYRGFACVSKPSPGRCVSKK